MALIAAVYAIRGDSRYLFGGLSPIWWIVACSSTVTFVLAFLGVSRNHITRDVRIFTLVSIILTHGLILVALVIFRQFDNFMSM